MDRFEYVMVLISIILGLGIAHVLLGVGGIIDRRVDRRSPLGLSLAHAVWLVHTFVWMVLFWWWEFRFSILNTEWSVGLYFFLVTYSVVLFLMAVILVPRTWDGVADLGQYFIERRAWFYSLLLAATALDIVDAFVKGGWDYASGDFNGPWVWGLWGITVPIFWVGIRSRDLRYHNVMGVTYLIWQVMSSFEIMPRLGF